MNHNMANVSLLGACLMLAACGMFGKEKETGQPKRLMNATEYQCEGGGRFHVRMEDKGNTAWLLYPDREIALAKQESSTRYSNGVVLLEIKGTEATLQDGTTTFNGCKAAGK